MTFSAQDKLDAVERELRFRRRVYENKVRQGSMSPQKSAHEIAVMEAIRDDYIKLAKQERLL